jgi:hypothetical protein
VKLPSRRFLSIALVVLCLIPIRTVTVPPWRLRFVDELGRPFSSLPVGETWRNYSIEVTDHHADGLTNTDGYVEFPEHTLWAPLLLRIVGPVRSVLGSGVHAGFGRSAWIFSKCGLAMRGSRLPTYWGDDLPDRVVLGYDEIAARFHPDPRCAIANQQARGAVNGST